jgi:glucose/arabinose dehydrogenase
VSKCVRTLLVLGTILGAGSALAQTVVDAALTVQQVLPDGSLNQPTSMAFLADNDFLILEKGGNVRRVTNGVLQGTPVLSIPTDSFNERGLLGIAIASGSPRWVFLYVTQAASPGGTAIANRLWRYTWNPATGQLGSAAMLLDLPFSPGPNHDGGVVALGRIGEFPGVGDGAALYTVIGDLNRSGQTQNNAGGAAPDDTGVIFRLLQDGSPAPGNPFTPYCSGTTTQTCTTNANCPAGQQCLTQVADYYAFGVRNSFGLTVDRATGRLWDTENGPGSYDEINLVPAGLNSGWTDLMGPDSRDPQGTGDLFNMPGAGLTYSDPEFSWLGTVAPTGILLPQGSTLGSAYDSVALVGDNNFGQIYRLQLNAARTAFTSLPASLTDLVADTQTEANQVRWGQGFGVVTDLEQAPNGDLYVVDLANGTVFRIFRPAAPPIPVFPSSGD